MGKVICAGYSVVVGLCRIHPTWLSPRAESKGSKGLSSFDSAQDDGSYTAPTARKINL